MKLTRITRAVRNVARYTALFPLTRIIRLTHLYRYQREIPPGLSKRDARILKSVKRRAHHLDTGLSLCGFRVGWTFFFGESGNVNDTWRLSLSTSSQGIVPGAGDALNAVLGYTLVIRKAKQAELGGNQCSCSWSSTDHHNFNNKIKASRPGSTTGWLEISS